MDCIYLDPGGMTYLSTGMPVPNHVLFCMPMHNNNNNNNTNNNINMLTWRRPKSSSLLRWKTWGPWMLQH